MRYINVIFRIVTIICFMVLIPFSYKIAEESELIYGMYIPMNDEIAEQDCYDMYNEQLKIDMLKVNDKIIVHSTHGYENWILVTGITIFIFLLGLILTILEIKKSK